MTFSGQNNHEEPFLYKQRPVLFDRISQFAGSLDREIFFTMTSISLPTYGL